MYACCRYNLFTYLVTLHTENLNAWFSFLTQGVQLGGAVVSTAPTKWQVPSNWLVQLRQLHPLKRTAPPVKSK